MIMQNTYLEVTYRGGKLLAAYLYLNRQEGDRSAKVKKHGPGLLVDLAADGRPIGIEIAIPSLVTLDAVNGILDTYGLPRISSEDLAPLGSAA
jgi:hypothetical protein